MQLDIFNNRKQNINENNVASEGLNLSEEDRRKVYILQTISDYELNLTLTQRKYLAVKEHSRSSHLEVFLGKVLKI